MSNITKSLLVQGIPREDQLENQYRQSLTRDIQNSMRQSSFTNLQLIQNPTNTITQERKFLGGQNLELVCFLMSVEIERLRGEADSWKFRYTDLDRRINDRSGLENQIRIMTVDLNEYKTKTTSLVSENERLRSVIIPLQQELEMWKRKYNEVDITTSSKYQLAIKEIEEWKTRCQKFEITILELRQSESRYRDLENKLALITSEYERIRIIVGQKDEELERTKRRLIEIDSFNIRFREQDEKIVLLTREIEKLTAILRSKDNEMGDLFDKIEEYKKRTMYLETQITELRLYEGRWGESQSKMNALIQEIESLRIQLSDRNREIDSLRAQLEEQMNHQERVKKSANGQQQTINQLQGLIQQRDFEIEELKKRINSLEITISETRIYESRIQESQGRIFMLQQENERYLDQLRIRTVEIEGLQQKCVQYEAQLRVSDSKLNEQKDKIRALITEIESLRVSYSKLEIQITEYRSFDVKRQDQERHILLLSKEIDSLRSQLSERIRECDDIRIRLSEEQRIRNEERVSFTMFQNRYNEINILIEAKNKEIDEWKQRYSTITLQLNDVRVIETRYSEVQNRVVLLSQEVERLTELLKIKGQENEKYLIRISTLEQSFSGSEIRIREYVDQQKGYESRIYNLTIEIDSLRLQLSDRFREIEELKGQLSDQQSQHEIVKRSGKQNQQQLQQLTQTLEITRVQLEEYQNKCRSLEIQINEMRVYEIRYREQEEKIALLASEMERQKQIIRQKIEEIDVWKVKCSKLEVQLNEIRVYELRVTEYEGRISGLIKELDDWRVRYHNLEIQSSQYTIEINKYRQLDERCVLLSSEIERLNNQLRQRDADNDSFKYSINQLEITINQYRTYEQRFKDSERTIIYLQNEIDNLKQTIYQKEQEIQNLNGQLYDEKQNHENVKRSGKNHQNQIQSLTTIIQQREKEIGELSFKLSQTDTIIAELRIIESRYAESKDTINSLILQLDQWKQKYNSIEIQIGEYRMYEIKLRQSDEKLSLLTQEIERLTSTLQAQMDKYKQLEYKLIEYRSFEEKNRVLSIEIDRLNSIHLQDSEELKQWRYKYVEYTSLNKRVQEHLYLFVLLFTEIEALRYRLRSKEQEVDEVRRSSLAPYRI